VPLTPGSRLGPYEIVGKIGAGGMGEVYRARDLRLGRDVALKILPDAFARDPDRLARFEREARALAALNHPNIAQIHGLEEAGGTRALVLEFVDGPTLADRLTRGRIDVDEALTVARQIALALEAAHDQGIIHRDLKPANVKVRDDGTVKVLDFGLAKALDPLSDALSPENARAELPTITSPAVTANGIILGTAAYMSPEQARGRPVDRRADIWAFGCVLYEMLTGRRAFDGEDVSTTIAAVLKEAPDLHGLPVGLASSTRRVLRRCLEKDPRNRLSAISDARMDLDERDDLTSVTTLAHGSSFVAALGGAAVGAIVTAIAAWLVLPPAAAGTAEIIRDSILPPADFDFFHDAAGAAISPDGKRIAFISESRGPLVSQLWVRDRSSLTPRRLEGTEGATLPFWSPRSDRIAFFADGKLNTISVEGGRVQTVCDAKNGRGGTWNRNDVIVFADTSGDPLKRVPAGGGDPKPATTLDTAKKEASHRYPAFLPDDDHFLFTALPRRGEKYEIFVGSLSTDARTLVGAFENMPVLAPSGYLLFMRKGVLVGQAFDLTTRVIHGEIVPLDDAPGWVEGEWDGAPAVSVSTSGLMLYTVAAQRDTELAWVDQSGKPLGRIALQPRGFYTVPVLSPDGLNAAIHKIESPTAVTIWRVELSSGRMQPVSLARGRNYAPVWSPDGQRIYFTSNRDGRDQVYVKDLAEARPETVVYESPALFKQVTSITRDGRFLVQELADQTDVWLASPQGQPKQAALLNTAASEQLARISPDNRWVGYVSDKSGRMEVYVDAFPALGHEQRITLDGGQDLAWHKEGRQLAVLTPTGVYVIDLIIGGDVRPGSVHRLDITLQRDAFGADVTTDFRRFLFSMGLATRVRPSLALVTGWESALARRR
jgi:Tol biopolymer transport system component